MAPKKTTTTPKANGDKAAKMAALQAAMWNIEKKFGSGSITLLWANPHFEVETIPSWSLTLDAALGGGYAKGRIVEIYGAESSGKTTFALHAIAEVQKSGGLAAFIDAEHALDAKYAKAIGVNTEELVIAQPDFGEQALEMVEQLVSSGSVDLIVVDSVAALTPKAEIEGNMGDSFMGLQARMMSQALRKITGIVNKSDCTVIFINQTRSKIGVMFGSPETTTGGNALKFYASQRLKVSGSEKTEGKNATTGEKEYVGKITKVSVVKNKVAPPFRDAEMEIEYGVGISRLGEILDIGDKTWVVKKAGAFYSYGETRLGQGRDNSKKFLAENPELAEKIHAEIRNAILNQGASVKQTDEEFEVDDEENDE